MIVFSNLSLKRGQTELLDNASATINPKQKVGLVESRNSGIGYPSNWLCDSRGL